MGRRPLALALALVLTLTGTVFAQTSQRTATLTWKPSPEAGVGFYNVYTCPTLNCTVLKVPGKAKYSLNQPGRFNQGGVVANDLVLKIVIGDGAAAVTAYDVIKGTESGLSNQGRIVGTNIADKLAPQGPSRLTIR